MEHGSDCCQSHVHQLLVVELDLAMVQLVSESFWRAICMVNFHAFLVEYVNGRFLPLEVCAGYKIHVFNIRLGSSVL